MEYPRSASANFGAIIGFKYVKTYRTVPGAINFHQAVTRWVLER
jgi:hypothetical protein